MTDLIRIIRYGQQKAKGGRVDITPELISEFKWIEHLNQVRGWIARDPNAKFFGMEELIEECPNKAVRDLFKGILDEWNQMLAEQLHIVAEDYYFSRVDILLGQAEVLAGAYDGVRTLSEILEWYMNK